MRSPLHLQETLGRALPIACALDGYPIYGLNEPDGSSPQGLDAFNGHETAALGYHYHASKKYPFVNGCFHGVVVEREEQVEPQPRAQGVRPALTALRGAKILWWLQVGAQLRDRHAPALRTRTRPRRVTRSRFCAAGETRGTHRDAYLKEVNARMVTKNPSYDPANAPSPEVGRARKGGKGGKAGKKRNDE